MVQLRTVLTPADNTGAKKLRLILIHGGSKRKFGYLGDLITASVIQVDPQGQFKKGVTSKDAIMKLIAMIGIGGGKGQMI